jgi:BirA family transcriptional regulator, biotin operon repressor / biotin---[acetyl-CoA-carboxylase] ligase
MNLSEITSSLSGLPLGQIQYFDRIGSTNDEAAQWADREAPDLSMVIADEQTAGKGRQGRVWLTPPGAALAFSLVMRDFSRDEIGVERGSPLMRLTALGAVGVCEALLQSYSLHAQIKWPNDVLLERRKTAGILVEAHWIGENLDAAILGIGINIAPESAPPDGRAAFPAISVQQVLGRPIARLELLRSVLSELIALRRQLTSPSFIQVWDRYLAFKGEWVMILENGESEADPPRQGLVLGLDRQGRLRLQNPGGEEFTLLMGELRLRPVDS